MSDGSTTVDSKGEAYVSRAAPVVGVFLSGLSLFSTNAPGWVQYSAGIVGLLLVLAWFLSTAGRKGKGIRARWFPPRLSSDHVIRLGALLDEASNHMSYSYTMSPFYVWHKNSGMNDLRMNYTYHAAVYAWLLDVKEKVSLGEEGKYLDSLYKAVSAVANLGGYVETELAGAIRRTDSDVDEGKKREIEKEWEQARGHFNLWLDKWRSLFVEIAKARKLQDSFYIKPLGMVR